MTFNTKIQWTDHTFNPWWGCTKISPGCDHCYAEELAHRFGTQWGVNAKRKQFGMTHWHEPLQWNKRAQAAGQHKRVFCASMADIFDNNAPEGERERLWNLIEQTPHLDWQLLTKRIGNVREMMPSRWQPEHAGMPRNIWLGITIVNQDEAERDISKLAAIDAQIRFLSCEPLLGALNLKYACFNGADSFNDMTGIDWVIVGGESGVNARPMNLEWANDIRLQCDSAGVPFFMKQLGGVRDKRGAIEDFPDYLRIREFPKNG